MTSPKQRILILFSSLSFLSLAIITYGLKGYLIPLSLAIALVYLTKPIQQSFKQIGFSSLGSTVTVSLLLLIFMLALVLQGIPVLIQEFSKFIQSLPSSIESAYLLVNKLLLDYGLQLQIPNWQAIIDRIIDTQDITSLNALPKLLTNTIQHSLDIILFFTSMLFIPLFFFFALKDGERAVHNFIDWTPAAIRQEVSWFISILNDTLTTWISGQGTLIIILCILYTIGLGLVGSSYSFTLGIMTGLLYIIPAAGFILSFTVALITMIATYGASYYPIIKIVILYGSIQTFESLILAPWLLGNKLGINLPGALLSIMIGGGLFGPIGILLAIPAVSLIKKILGNIFSRSDEAWIID
ncbi:AI-2E family transporter [Candidatus Comchoanobacter bicostacola]|uniref:AI-2E family transporter n=1 Tax=Candidatus Comchoanobacter bicostacola TaxID=2919598 RepID=A0ABY5DJG4_9GAMM|nr:AI-2E family transporter [Candidatus Comchoanobacter bicostacola]UTC24676.1 AI-2E family transporter [Candidatus Comchoanobacter bicostacola]